MKENIKIKLNCEFPIVDLGNVEYKHTKVRKALVPGYIMLTYISKWPKKDATMAECLAEAGINGDMIDIFRDEVYKFCYGNELQILETDVSRDDFKDRFLSMKIGDFDITDIGEEMFRNQYVPSGYEEKGRKQLFYDIAKREYSIKQKTLSNNNIIANSKFSEDVENMLTEATIKDYLDSIPKELNLQDEERVTSVIWFDKNIKFFTQSVDIEISSNGASFTCNDITYVDFLTNRYSSDELSSMVKKEVGSLSFQPSVAMRLEDLDNYIQIFKSSDLNKLKNRNCAKIIFSSRLVNEENKTWVDFLSQCMPDYDAMSIELDGQIHVFQAVRLDVNPLGTLGNRFLMDVFVERQVEPKKYEDIYKKVVQVLIDEPIKDNSKLLKCIVSKGYITNVKDFAWNKIKAANDEAKMIDVFKELCDTLKGEDKWRALQKEVGDMLLEYCRQDLTIDNLSTKADLIRKFAGLMLIDDYEIASKLAEKLPQTTTLFQKCEALLKAKFSENIVLALANVIIPYTESVIYSNEISDDNSIARKFKTLAGSLIVLKNMLGIEDNPYEYVRREITEASNFKATVKSFVSDYETFKKAYRKYAEEQWKSLEPFYDAVVAANKLLLLNEKPSSQYTKEDFKYLANSDGNNCIEKLVKRAEIEFCKVWGIGQNEHPSLLELLEQSKTIISKDDYETLNHLRLMRNEQVHKDKLNAHKVDLPKTIDCVFRIIAMKPKNEQEK